MLGIIVGLLSVACVSMFFVILLLILAVFGSNLGMLHVTDFSWGYSENSADELLFQVTTANFGYMEGTDVEVTCDVYETDEYGYAVGDYPMVSVSENIGNVASTSTKLSELTYDASDVYIDMNQTIGVCYVSECPDCEILTERLPG